MTAGTDISHLPFPQGEVTGIRPDGLAGWAWNPSTPHETLEVEALVDGRPAGAARAELFEAGLGERGIGNGSHGFRVTLDHIPALPCRIGVRIRDAQSELPGGFTATDLAAIAPAIAPQVRFEGAVDDIRPGRIHGWVVDRCRPGARVQVALRDWKEVLCYVVADIHRQELQNRGFGDGRCAFAIHLPVFVLNGHQHTLRITAEDVDWELPGGRINFDEKAARALVEVIAPWRADVARIDGALAKLDQLIDRAEKSQDRSSLLDRAREWLTREK